MTTGPSLKLGWNTMPIAAQKNYHPQANTNETKFEPFPPTEAAEIRTIWHQG